VKPTSKQIIKLLEVLDPSILIYLFYGSDRGLTHERVGLVLKKLAIDANDPFCLSQLTGSDIKKNPGCLIDAAISQSLTGGTRAVHVKLAGEDITKSLEQCLEHGNISVLLLEAGELTYNSPVRKFIEKNARTAAFPGYLDNRAGLKELIRSTLENCDISIDRTARDYLIDNLGSDRMVSRSEMEKLITYMGSEQNISLNDVYLNVSDNGAFSIDKIVYPVASGNHLEVEINLQRAFNEGLSSVGIIRATTRHFQKLHLTLGYIETGLSPKDAIKKIKPPIFLLFIDEFLHQADRWSIKKIEKAMDLLTEAEVSCKSTGMPTKAICGRTLMRLSKAISR
jgi:DNA polymerase-3 subunit delta